MVMDSPTILYRLHRIAREKEVRIVVNERKGQGILLGESGWFAALKGRAKCSFVS